MNIKRGFNRLCWLVAAVCGLVATIAVIEDLVEGRENLGENLLIGAFLIVVPFAVIRGIGWVVEGFMSSKTEADSQAEKLSSGRNTEST